MGTKPNGTKPKGTKPKGTNPKGTKPKGTKPKGTKPKVTKPKGKSYTKTLVLIESFCVFKSGFISLEKHLISHFLSTFKRWSNWGAFFIIVASDMFMNYWMFVFFDALVQVPRRRADKNWITQITLEIVHNALFVNDRWFVFLRFQILAYLFVSEYGSEFGTNFCM